MNADTTTLINLLTERRGRWVTAKQLKVLSAHVGGRDSGWDRRYIADMADSAKGRIISTTKGYKLQEHARDEEILKAYGELTRKAENTGKRANDIISYYHRHRLQPAKTQSESEMQGQLL